MAAHYSQIVEAYRGARDRFSDTFTNRSPLEISAVIGTGEVIGSGALKGLEIVTRNSAFGMVSAAMFQTAIIVGLSAIVLGTALYGTKKLSTRSA